MIGKAEGKSARAPGIFISYRRKDTAGHAGRLKDALENHFAGGVFMDVEKIAAGQDFVKAIDDAVGKCSVLLVLIGDQWLSVADSSGRRRLDDPEDFVRREIASALRRDITVIPVLVEGAAMPAPADLPDELKDLSRRNAQEISDTRWGYDVGQLIKELEKHCEVGGLKGVARGRRKVLLGAGVAALVAAASFGLYLSSGRGEKVGEVDGSAAAATIATPANAAAATPTTAADPKEKEEIKHALQLVGSLNAASDEVLQRMTSPLYDPDEAPDEETFKLRVGEWEAAVEKFTGAKESWKREQGAVGVLMGKWPVAGGAWNITQSSVNAYMNCVEKLYEDKRKKQKIAPDVCQQQQQQAEDGKTLLEKNLAAIIR
jgi:hypothetical protein